MQTGLQKRPPCARSRWREVKKGSPPIMPPMPACSVFDFVYFTPMCDDPRHKLKVKQKKVAPKTLLVAWSLVRIDCPRAVSRSPLFVDVLLA